MECRVAEIKTLGQEGGAGKRPGGYCYQWADKLTAMNYSGIIV
jgi:hypothetical protein